MLIERLGKWRTLGLVGAVLAAAAVIVVLSVQGLNAAFALSILLAAMAVLGLAKLQVDVSVRLRRIDQRILKLRDDNFNAKRRLEKIDTRIIPVESAIPKIRSELDSHIHSNYDVLEPFGARIEGLEGYLSDLLAEVKSIHHGVGDLHKPGQDYRQVEALLGLHQLLDFRQRVPPMRGWSASPDFLLEMVSHILANRPRTVLECGSGVSTLVTAYALRHVGMGHVFSLEHGDVFARQTNKLLKLHGLSDWATLLNAPLREVELQGERWMWYEPAVLEVINTVAFVVVDGPPRATQSLARYPLMPIIYEKLIPKAIVMVDDYNRTDERAVVERWMAEFEGLTCQELDHEKGTAVVLYGA